MELIKKILAHHDQFKTISSCALWWKEVSQSPDKEAILKSGNFEVKFSHGGDDYEYRSVIENVGKKYPFYRGYFFKNGFLKSEKVFRDLLS